MAKYVGVWSLRPLAVQLVDLSVDFSLLVVFS